MQGFVFIQFLVAECHSVIVGILRVCLDTLLPVTAGILSTATVHAGPVTPLIGERSLPVLLACFMVNTEITGIADPLRSVKPSGMDQLIMGNDGVAGFASNLNRFRKRYIQ